MLEPVKTVEQAQAQPNRATLAEVYNQVITDLTKAAELLPGRNTGRVNQHSAKALQARVYLQQGEYAKARDAAHAVITSGAHSLNPDVVASFVAKNSAENLFEIQQNEQNNAGRSNDGLATFFACINGFGRADVELRPEILALYEEQDTRLTELVYVGGGECNKVDAERSFKWNDAAQNLPVIRLAEMYLIRAEANFRLGTTVGATPLQDVNLVRVRAGATPYNTITLDRIILERQLELAFEGHRIHDLKRLGKTTGIIPANSPKLVLPVPQREIDVNPNLVQNEGY